MALIAVYIVWEDLPVLRRSVASAWKVADRVVAVDGRFQDFPGDNWLSEDGTREYLDQEMDVELIDGPKLKEPDKRNLYLVGKPGDYYLALDADEVFVGELALPEDGELLVVNCQRESDRKRYKRVRVFPHSEGIHYYAKHYWLRDRMGRTMALLDKVGDNYTGRELAGGHIEHLDKERLHARKLAKKVYYQLLKAREKPIAEVT